MKHILLISILFIFANLSTQAQKIEFEKLSAKKFHALILEDEDYLLIDVNSKSVFDKARIQGAICAETSQILFSILDTTPENLPILIYCKSGERSLKACWLIKEKYPHKIFNLNGGLESWEAKGYKVSSDLESSI